MYSLDSTVPDPWLSIGSKSPSDLAWAPSDVYVFQILNQRAAADPHLMELLRKVKVGQASKRELMIYNRRIYLERIQFNKAHQAAAGERVDIQKDRKVKQILNPRANPFEGHQSMRAFASVSFSPSMPG
jgi:hypothetical protein